MFTFEEIGALLSAIGGNALSLWSGILGVAFTVLSVFQKDTLKRPMLVFGIIGLFLSPVLAWRDEYRQRSTLTRIVEDRRPKLVGEIETYRGYENADGIIIFVLVSVSNIGQVSTTAQGFRMTLKLPRFDDHSPHSPSFYDDMKIENRFTQQVDIYNRSDSVFEKMKDPISPGAIKRGWLMFRVTALRYVDTYGGTIAITFLDTQRQGYAIESEKMTGKPNLGSNKQPAFPGIEPLIPKPERQ